MATQLAGDLCREILTGCDDEQVAAITEESRTLRVIASAGSGKTRVLTRRIAWRIAREQAVASHVLAITFTRKAAGELRGRLAALKTPGVTASTFHGAAFAQLRQAAIDAGRRPSVILDSKGRLLREIVVETFSDRKTAADKELINGLAAEIEWAKARVVRPGEYVAAARAAGRRPPLRPGDVASLYELYEAALRKKGLVDFEGLLVDLARMIEDDPTFAAAQRWRFRHIYVDEFQDVNAAQLKLLEAWLGPNLDVCVVGDPDQSIYAWNGSDPGIMTSLERRWPGLVTLDLSTNYRSTPEVLAAASGVLAPGRSTAAHRPAGCAPTITVYKSEADEAEGVAAALRTAHRPGRAWRQLAVLARTNAQLLAFRQACGRRGIPCRLAAGSILDRPAVRRALASLGKEGSCEVLGRFVVDLEQAVADASALPIGDEEDGSAAGNEEDDLAGNAEAVLELAALASSGREYTLLDPRGTVNGFLAWLRGSWRDQDGGGADAVEMTTFHRAKGLQWQVIFVTGLEDGLVPIGSSSERSADAEAEERRLLYVALTRAEDELHCSWAAARRFGARSVRREPSPYLRAIEAVSGAAAGGQRRGAPLVERVAALRARASASASGPPGAAASAPDPLMTALREWRSATARGARVPAYVVFPDKTLEAIVAARPRTLRQLLGVPGIGPSRSALYGEKLLALVADHLPHIAGDASPAGSKAIHSP